MRKMVLRFSVKVIFCWMFVSVLCESCMSLFIFCICLCSSVVLVVLSVILVLFFMVMFMLVWVSVGVLLMLLFIIVMLFWVCNLLMMFSLLVGSNLVCMFNFRLVVMVCLVWVLLLVSISG